MQQHRNPWRYRLIASAWLALAIPVIGCGSEVRIGGASVHAAFADPQAGALAAAAAARGEVAEIDRLVQAGADVNATGKDNVTPLAIALAKRNLAGVKRLLALGADPNHVLVRDKDPRQRTALLYLVVVGDAFDERFLEAFLQHGGNPNTLASNSQSLLMLAVHKRPYVELLLRYGADINYQTIGESTALWDAVALNQLDTAQYLLEQGASVGLEKVAVTL
ncbi:MAG TPA: ankyrin repeat domain-containing protein, partial [Gammaproteobacteria bacterium]|nr:ankyrin repeat domain-containing protein [Gammaproteobacteria bacterium]